MKEVKSVGERVRRRKDRDRGRKKERKGKVNSQQTEMQSVTLTGKQSVYKHHR